MLRVSLRARARKRKERERERSRREKYTRAVGRPRGYRPRCPRRGHVPNNSLGTRKQLLRNSCYRATLRVYISRCLSCPRGVRFLVVVVVAVFPSLRSSRERAGPAPESSLTVASRTFTKRNEMKTSVNQREICENVAIACENSGALNVTRKRLLIGHRETSLAKLSRTNRFVFTPFGDQLPWLTR